MSLPNFNVQALFQHHKKLLDMHAIDPYNPLFDGQIVAVLFKRSIHL